MPAAQRTSRGGRSRPAASLAALLAALLTALLVVVAGCSGPAPASTPAGGVAAVSGTAAGTTGPAGTGDPDSATDVGRGVTLDTTGRLVDVRQSPDVVSPAAAQQVAAVLTDLERFWSQRLGGAFEAPRGGYLLTDTAARTTAATAPTAASAAPGQDVGCAGSPESLRGNAFYCPGDDSIVIDAAALVPVLRSSYGTGGLATALAHEYGHLVQARIGPTVEQQAADRTRYPQVLVEGQADCAAGAYLRWAGTPGSGSRLRLTAAALPTAVAPLVDFRDPTTTAPGEQFHGYGLDRLRAVVRGYRLGTAACAAMTVADLRLTLGRSGTSAPSATPRFADAAAVTAAARTALTAVDPAAALPAAATPDPAALAAAAPLGQYAQASVTLLLAGARRFPSATGAACFLGAATGRLYGRPVAGLGAWRGDADEALDLVRDRASGRGDGWSQLLAFVGGFDTGERACR